MLRALSVIGMALMLLGTWSVGNAQPEADDSVLYPDGSVLNPLEKPEPQQTCGCYRAFKGAGPVQCTLDGSVPYPTKHSWWSYEYEEVENPTPSVKDPVCFKKCWWYCCKSFFPCIWCCWTICPAACALICSI